MAHKLTVRPCEGAVYLLNLSTAREEHMGQRNGRNPGGPGCGAGDAGTGYRHSSTSGLSYSQCGRNSDDRNGTRTVGAVPGPRSGRSRAGQQDLVSQHRTATNPN